jgi:anti-sigma-K factor RskA
MNLLHLNGSKPQDCDEVHALIPAYSVGATDPEETRLVEAHLKTCLEAAAELKEYRSLTEKLLYSVPPMQAPARIHDQLMAKIQESNFHQSAASHNGLSKPLALRSKIKSTFATKINQPALLLTALALLLLLLSNLYWSNQLAQLQNNQQQIHSLLEDRDAVLALIGAGKAQRVDLRQVQGGDVEATMLCNPKETIGFIYGENFVTLAAGETYQVWLVRDDGSRVHAGILRTNEQGDGTLIFQLSEPFANFDRVEITRESTSSTSGSSSSLVMQGTLPY